MNEQDLRDRLALTVATDLGEPPIDPTADLRRGRTRLRHHRIATGFATVTSVAAVAALGLQLVPASSADRQDTAPATRPTTTPAVADVKTRQQQASRLANETLKKLDLVAHRHIDPGLKYSKQTIAESYSLPTASDSSSKPFGVGIGKRWQQNGELGQLDVGVSAGTHTMGERGWCKHGGKPVTRDSVNLTCTTTTAPNGRRIVTAKAAPTASPPAWWKGALLVRYERPDGQVVTVSVHGITKPSVTLQQLIAAAIDPEMSLPK